MAGVGGGTPDVRGLTGEAERAELGTTLEKRLSGGPPRQVDRR